MEYKNERLFLNILVTNTSNNWWREFLVYLMLFVFQAYIFLLFWSLCPCICVQLSAGACRGQRCEVPWTWSYKWLVISHLIWVLGIERASLCTLNCSIFCPVPCFLFFDTWGKIVGLQRFLVPSLCPWNPRSLGRGLVGTVACVSFLCWDKAEQNSVGALLFSLVVHAADRSVKTRLWLACSEEDRGWLSKFELILCLGTVMPTIFLTN